MPDQTLPFQCPTAPWAPTIQTSPGPLPHTLISILGPRLRGEFEEQLEAAMSELGDEAFRYHFAFIFAVASLPP